VPGSATKGATDKYNAAPPIVQGRQCGGCPRCGATGKYGAPCHQSANLRCPPEQRKLAALRGEQREKR